MPATAAPTGASNAQVRALLVQTQNQFGLRNLADQQLAAVAPTYRSAVDNILRRLADMPEDALARELWLKTHLANLRAQWEPVADRLAQLLPPAQVEAFTASFEAAANYLDASVGTPTLVQPYGPTGQGLQLPTPAGQLGLDPRQLAPGVVLQRQIQMGFAPAQLHQLAQGGGFSSILGGTGRAASNGKPYTLDQALVGWLDGQGQVVEDHLRRGFLLGDSNSTIRAGIGPMGPGRKGWAQTDALVRTSMMEASQAAHDAFNAAHADLINGYEWDASHDGRLCPVCAAKDGRRTKTREEQGPCPAHWNCRCRVLPRTATSDLLEQEDTALRAQGKSVPGVPDPSYLEAVPVEYGRNARGQRIRLPAPEGYGPNGGLNAYKNPMRVDGRQQWVRRVDMPDKQVAAFAKRGQPRALAGDFLQHANPNTQRAVLGSDQRVAQWQAMVGKGGRWHNDPQGALVTLLRGQAPPPPPRAPRVPKPKGPGPVPPGAGGAARTPRPKATPTPRPAPPAPRPKATPKPTPAPPAAVPPPAAAPKPAPTPKPKATPKPAPTPPPPPAAPASPPLAQLPTLTDNTFASGRAQAIMRRPGKPGPLDPAKSWDNLRQAAADADPLAAPHWQKADEFARRWGTSTRFYNIGDSQSDAAAMAEALRNTKATDVLAASQDRAARSLQRSLDNWPDWADPADRNLLEQRQWVAQSHATQLKAGRGPNMPMASQGQDVGGYTTATSGHINLGLRADINNVGPQTARNMVRQTQDALQAASRGNPRWLATGDNRDTDPRTQWLTNWVHELGHQVHMRAVGSASTTKAVRAVVAQTKPGNYLAGHLAAVSRYGDTNHMERFAEAFVQYMLNPTQLKAAAPELYSWVDTYLLSAINNAKALGL
jgi:hypothetical protein